MIILITGASHTGKTLLAQKLMEQYHYPYISIDHLKMGLIRSGQTPHTPTSPDEDLTAYLWPIVREMIKTAIENNQNMIIEGCYIPLNWAEDFTEDCLPYVQCYCLVMTQEYIKKHFTEILAHENVIEQRQTQDFTMEDALNDNARYMEKARESHVKTVLIHELYDLNEICKKLTNQFQ